MGKRVIISQDSLIAMKENLATLNENVEADKFYLGQESDNPPVGGNYAHIEEESEEPTESNTFERWYGNSILKDENGMPLKMYHGTGEDFNTFDKKFIGKSGAYEGYGFNFTPFKSRAMGYNPKNVIEAYLKVENPMTSKTHKITLRQLMSIISELDKGKPFTDTIVAAYEPARYNENWDAAYYKRALPTAARAIYDYNKECGYGDAGLYAELCLNGQADTLETISAFEKMGYDAAIFYDNEDRINTVVVFEPNQIKRTTNKTFNPNSDIMDEDNAINEGYCGSKLKYIGQRGITLNESQESKSISAAKKLVMQRLNYNEQQADEFIRIKLRNDIPILRTPQGSKFILGATRMFCDGELRTANDISSLNSTLKLVASDAHINEYDRNLNGLSFNDLVQRFAKAMSDNLEAEKAEVGQMAFDTPSDYEIVRIDSFEQAMKYGKYTSWCVTHQKDMFDSYASDGINQFYFCLKNGFENVEAQPSEGCPLDEYGLSMIAVSVNENGMLNTCTCRWNHDNGGDDSIMNTKQISEVIGMNFFEVFKPNGKWDALVTNVKQRLANGEDFDNVFDECEDFHEGFARVKLNNKYNFINKNGEFLSEQWFDACEHFYKGFARVKFNRRWYRINKNGKIKSNESKMSRKNILVSETQLKAIKENFDFEVNSSEIDLSSFKKKDELVPSIWKDGLLDSRIRLKLLDIADDFWDFVNIKWVRPNGIILTGSICNFNWSSFSDIDLHLIVDFSEIDERSDFVRDYLDSKKNEWNNEHEGLNIMGFNVELYVQDFGEMPKSGGIYDLEGNDWIKKPSKDEIKPIGLNKFSIKDKAAQIMTIIDNMYDALVSTDDSHEIEEIGNDAKMLWKKVKEMRKSSLERGGEMGSGNVVYKYIRRQGYLDKLWNLRTLCYDKSNSITESKKNSKKYTVYVNGKEESNFNNKEIIREYLEKNNNLPLYKYYKWAKTASSCEKARDLAYSCCYYIDEYIKSIYYRYSEFENLLDDDKFNYVDEEKIETFCKLLEENNLCDHFISIMQDIVNRIGLYNELPSWCYMDFNRIVKNEWCIHFTKDARNIVKYGFTGGTEDIDHLAYTDAGQEKPSAGYNFAFLINDRNVDYNEYGDEAVIFRTSGVEIYHYGDNENQVIFWGPNVKNFIPIHQENGDWVVYGENGQVLVRKNEPSKIAIWATENLPQYRKQIMTGKNGYIPKHWVYDKESGKMKVVPYPIYKNESIKKYIKLLKENLINEETVADGSSEGNPYSKRWKAEREALKTFISNYGRLMQSKEDDKGGKLYKVFWDKNISQLIGYNYALCVQWDEQQLKPKSTVYIRALDKFTPFIRQNVQYDTRGRDNDIRTNF